MGKEWELKYRVDDLQLLDCILCDTRVRTKMTENFRYIKMNTCYYDLPDGSLAKRGWTLRVRQENERSVVTCKTPAGGGLTGKLRNEWECEAVDLEEGLSKLLSLGAPKELSELSPEALEMTCGAQFTRIAALLRLSEDTTAEICGDVGELLRGGRRAPLCELELELKEGSEQTLLAFAAALNETYRLPEQPLSKFARAKAL